MSIIALAGKAGVGKDEMAAVLVKRHGFTRLALADPLRSLCSRVFKLDYSLFLDYDKKDSEINRVTLDYDHITEIRRIVSEEWGFEIDNIQQMNMEEYYGTQFNTPRDILRTVGTSLLRHNVRDDLWIVLAMSKIREIGNKVVITDCRFENEREFFGKCGAILCLVKRNDDGNTQEHEFEIGTDKNYDVVFNNNGTLGEFRSEVDMWYTLRANDLEYYTVFKHGK
jgi:hypothetical protein